MGRIKWCPDAEQALEHALAALRRGLLVRSWHWAVKAVEELDAATVGMPDDPDPGRVAVDQGHGAS